MLLRPGGGKLEGVSQNPIDTSSREDGLLDDHFRIGACIHAPPDFGVFALIVLSDHDEVDLMRLPSRQRCSYPFQKLHGPKIDVLLHFPSDGEEKPPE